MWQQYITVLQPKMFHSKVLIQIFSQTQLLYYSCISVNIKEKFFQNFSKYFSKYFPRFMENVFPFPLFRMSESESVQNIECYI